MLKLYYARPSLYARPVWLTLLEKQLPFELQPVNLGGDQFEPDFLALNPFGHVPILVDGDLRIIESLAILDYLEAKYPQPALLPQDATLLAKVRMVQMVALNELAPAAIALIIHSLESADGQYAQFRASNTLRFLEDLLDDRPYVAGDQLTLAEIVAGNLIHALPDLGVPLAPYPKLQRWSANLQARPSWQAIQLSSDEWSNFKRHMRVMPKVWQRRRRQRVAAIAQQS